MKTYYIPDNLNLDAICMTYEQDNNITINKDLLAFVVGYVIEIPSYIEGYKSNNGFVNVNAAKLQSLFREGPEYLRLADKLDILKCDYHFKEGKKSRGYRLADQYRTNLISYFFTDQKILRKISSTSRKQSESGSIPSKYRHLEKWFEGLQIDNRMAKDYLYKVYYPQKRIAYAIYQDKKAAILAKHYKDYSQKLADLESVKEPDPFISYSSALSNIDKIQNKIFECKVDSTISRFHSVLTRLQSDFRHFLSYQGEQLVEIDLVNSQPYFSTLLLDSEFYRTKNSKYATMLKKLNTQTQKQQPNHPTTHPHIPPPTLTLVKMMELSEKEDVVKYRHIVANEDLYKHFKDLLIRDGHEDITRDDAKNIMFQVLFTSNRFIGQKEAGPKRLFKKEFPTVYEVFSAYKRLGKEYLSILLQRIEAYVILEVVCNEISKAYPSVPPFTIHDSVITTERNAGLVWDSITHYCKQTIGIAPTLRPKNWDYRQL